MKYSVYSYKINIDEIVCINRFVQTIASKYKREGEKEVGKTKEKGAGDDQEGEENVIIVFGIGVVAGIDSFPSDCRCERGRKF